MVDSHVNNSGGSLVTSIFYFTTVGIKLFGFFKVNIQEEHLLMPTAGVAFSNENLRSLALSGLATTGSAKCMGLSLFACFVEIFPFMLCEPWLRC